MKKFLLVPVALMMLGSPMFNGLMAAKDHKVVICHAPPGNPANMHEISVDTSAVDAHLAHGDWVGSCQAGVEVPL